MTTLQFQDIDWAVLWQQARKKKKRQSKKAADWDKKAASFARRTVRSIYTEKFLALLAPEPEWSLLDVGCGPGPLTLPLAERIRRVTALDFSGSMLDILKQRATEQGLSNITCCKLSWEDDWQAQGLVPHDVAIASRSLAVPDLQDALKRLCRFGTRKVCITDRVQHGPMDPYAFAAVGRELVSGPDYIYTVNLLYQMGYLPAVSYIRLEETLPYPSFKEAFAGFAWMFRNLTERERKRLEAYVRSITTTLDDGSVLVQRQHVPTWAYISWSPAEKLG